MEHERNKRQIVVISLITAACLLGDSMLYIVLPVHYKEMGLSSLWEVGILLSVNRLVRLPLNPVIGWFYKIISIRTGVYAAVILTIITTASYGLVRVFWLLLVMRCLWGIAWTLLRLGAYFTVLEVSSKHTRGYFLGTYNGLFRLGSLFGMLLGGIIADLYGVSAAAFGFALVALAAIPFVDRSIITSSVESIPSHRLLGNTVSHWRSATVWWTLSSGLIIAMLYQGMFTATLSHFIESYNSTYVLGGLTLGAASLAGILQAVRWGWEPWLAPWFGRKSDGNSGGRPLFILTLLIAAVLFVIVPIPLPLWLWLLILLGIQLTATILTTVMDALAVDAATGDMKASVMTAYSVATDLGAALGPVLGYLSFAAMGSQGMFVTAAVLLVLIAIRWYLPWKSFRS